MGLGLPPLVHPAWVPSRPGSAASPEPAAGRWRMALVRWPSAPPAWARRLQAEQRASHYRQATSQAIKQGDRPGAPANPDLDQEE